MNEKQQQLTFDKGITNVPSDALCSDNALEESLGMVYDDGEHRVIQKPVPVITLYNSLSGGLYSLQEGVTPTFLYIHKVEDRDIYIGYSNVVTQGNTLDNQVYWGFVENNVFTLYYIFDIEYSDGMQITSVGKTLVISDATQKKYAVWKPENTGYLVIDNIPEPVIDFKMVYDHKNDGFNQKTVRHNAPTNGITVFPHHSTTKGKWDVTYPSFDQLQPFNDLIIGSYEKNLKTIAENKEFAEPFFVRYALEMFDGTYTLLSAPILMFPCITTNSRAAFYKGNGLDYMALWTSSAYLAVKANYDYTNLSDIVKGVAVFVSDGIHVYDTTVDQEVSGPDKDQDDPDYVPYIYFDTISAKDTSINNYDPLSKPPKYYANGIQISETPEFVRYNVPLVKRSQQAIEDDIRTTSVFYKIFTLGIKANGDEWERTSKYIKDKTLVNLTTQETLADDYFSHCQLVGKNMIAYNNRLLLSNTKRGFYEGHSSFLPFYNNSEYTYDVYVTIETDSGNRVVKKTGWKTYEKVGIYFFYPDPRARKAEFFISDTNNKICELSLEEHKGLNGAYYFDGLPSSQGSEPSVTAASLPTVNAEMEKQYNQIWVSEVNNPFVFRAEGNITVGDGEIIGISSMTQALSQGQFGQYPLIIFTTEGIWAASTGNTGLFMAVHPMSREICNRAKSITQTDGAIFFSSDKGLMLIIGSQVKCVSEQLSGKNNSFKVGNVEQLTDIGAFVNFLKEAVIAYDYRDSLLWIFKDNGTHAWIYSIKSGTFGHFALTATTPAKPITVVNDYPDYLIQNGSTVYSLMKRQNINLDTGTYGGTIITRPMKLENALALKSIMQIRHILQFTPYTVTESHEDPETHETVTTTTSQKGTMTLRIFASNNFDNWVELHSLRGTPWKYYRFRFDFSNMIATDRFAGTMLVTQERRTNKLR